MGAPLPRDGPGTPEGSRKWASLSFYRGQRAGLPLWDHQKSPVHKSTRIQGVTQTVYRRHRAGWRWWWCDSSEKKKKKKKPWFPHHVIAAVFASLVSRRPALLARVAEWWAADSVDPTFTPGLPDSFPSFPKQVANAPLRLFILICGLTRNLETVTSPAEENLPSAPRPAFWWWDKAPQPFLISPNSSECVRHGQSW